MRSSETQWVGSLLGEGGESLLPAYHPTTRAGGVFKIRDRRMRKPPESNFRAPKPLPHFASCSPTSQGADSHEGIVAAGRKRVPQVSAGRNHGRRQIRGARRLLVRKRKPPPDRFCKAGEEPVQSGLTPRFKPGVTPPPLLQALRPLCRRLRPLCKRHRNIRQIARKTAPLKAMLPRAGGNIANLQ